jgi:RNA polymerase sigma-70 factor (ECF subfamily)
MSPEPSFDTTQLHNYLDRMRAGDGGAADELLRKVCSRLERLARRMLRGYPNVQRWADTGDVLQSALLRLLRTLQNMRPETTREFMTLSALHIRRELLDLARHFRRRLDLPGGAHHDDTDPAVRLPDPHGAEAADLDRWSAFHTTVERLPDVEREVMSLTFYHGWTQPQVAELFGVDERTVRRRWRSACLKVMETLGEQVPDSE